MATPVDQDVFNASILVLKVIPNGEELVNNQHFMERLWGNIGKQWRSKIKKVIQVHPPTHPETETVEAETDTEEAVTEQMPEDTSLLESLPKVD